MDIEKYIATQVRDYEKKPPRKVWANVFLFLHYTAIANIWFSIKPVLFSKWVYVPAVAIITGTSVYYGAGKQKDYIEKPGKQLSTFSQFAEKPLLAVQLTDVAIESNIATSANTTKSANTETANSTKNPNVISENKNAVQKEAEGIDKSGIIEEEDFNTTVLDETKTNKNKYLERVFLLKTDEYNDIKNVIFKNNKGAIVHKVTYNKTNNPYFSIDIANLPKGRYTIYIETSEGLVKHKVINIK